MLCSIQSINDRGLPWWQLKDHWEGIWLDMSVVKAALPQKFQVASQFGLFQRWTKTGREVVRGSSKILDQNIHIIQSKLVVVLSKVASSTLKTKFHKKLQSLRYTALHFLSGQFLLQVFIRLNCVWLYPRRVCLCLLVTNATCLYIANWKLKLQPDMTAVVVWTCQWPNKQGQNLRLLTAVTSILTLEVNGILKGVRLPF